MKITNADFNNLVHNSMAWARYKTDWQLQEGRFENIEWSEAHQPEVDYEFAMAHWVKDYSAVLFVRAFLEALDFTYRVYYDTADDSYMITTNYGGVL